MLITEASRAFRRGWPGNYLQPDYLFCEFCHWRLWCMGGEL